MIFKLHRQVYILSFNDYKPFHEVINMRTIKYAVFSTLISTQWNRTSNSANSNFLSKIIMDFGNIEILYYS